MKSFVEKYKPKASIEIPQQLKILTSIIKNKKHAIVFGPTGSCKTSAVYEIARELNLEILEINASDFRAKEQIEKTIGEAAQQQSLFQREKILLIEEADCLSGREDRGGAQAIVNILKTSKFPVIITCNDPNNDKLKDIKKNAQLIEFKPIANEEITQILKNICKNENIKASDELLLKISIDCNGDLRAAINELQSNTINKELVYSKEPREYELSITHILNSVFKTKSFEVNKNLENSEMDLDELLLWLDENLPLQYREGTDLFHSYETISKADIFKGRIRKWQYWRLMLYQSLLLSSGVSLSKNKIINNFMLYKRPMRPLKIWQSNMRNAKKKSITAKLAMLTHTSAKKVFKNFLLYKNILKNEKVFAELKLDEEEINYIKNF